MNCGAWLGWQIDYLLCLQCFRDTSCHIFDKFFICITTFGEIIISILVISTIYWAISKKAGQFIMFSHIFGFLTNILAKTTACIYRPWILDARVKPLAEAIPAATGYSFPSGHTTGALSTWGGIAISFWKNKVLRYICFAIVICVMISRNYLGVHTPQDVIVGFILTALVLWGTYKLFEWEKSGKNRDIIIVLSVFAITILTILYVNLKGYPIDYLFGKILYEPTQMKVEAIVRSGFIFGAFIGWFIEKRFIDFKPELGNIYNKIIRVLLGIGILIAIHMTEGFFTNSFGIILGKALNLFLTGIYITLIYPYFIKKTSEY